MKRRRNRKVTRMGGEIVAGNGESRFEGFRESDRRRSAGPLTSPALLSPRERRENSKILLFLFSPLSLGERGVRGVRGRGGDDAPILTEVRRQCRSRPPSSRGRVCRAGGREPCSLPRERGGGAWRVLEESGRELGSQRGAGCCCVSLPRRCSYRGGSGGRRDGSGPR